VSTALLLDVDDTIIDTRTAMVAASGAAVAELWPALGAQARQAAAVHFHRDPRGFFGQFTRGEMSFSQMRAARVEDLLESFALAGVDDLNRRFEDAYAPAFRANVALFDDVVPLLEAARSAGVQVGLLTNSSSHTTAQKLEIAGLGGFFAVVATRDTLGFGKPDGRAFRHACRLLGSAPAETIYVGDHFEIDALAAQDAGLRAVWLQRDPVSPEDARRARARALPVVTTLSELPAMLVGH
jgi:putative hydrolase of the HAD superfamily